MTFHNTMLEGDLLELKDGEEADPAEAVTKALEAIDAKLSERLAALETKSADRLDRIETRLNRPGATAPKAEEPGELERKAFVSFLRAGTRGLGAEEQKALSVGVQTAGGYLAPDQFTTDFVRDLVLFSPIRGIADVRASSSHTVLVPKRTAITNAKWQGEAVATTASEPAFAQQEVEVKNLATHVDINNQLIDDAVVDVEAEVRLALAEDFGMKEGKAFVSGDGVLEPEGFMTAAGVPVVLNGHATNLSADQLIAILYSLAPAYRSASTWLMNGSTLATIRKLKDSQGNFLWQPGLVAGQPETILGRPVVEAVDMPDVAANAFPIALGAFKAAYRIYDRKAMEVKANPFLLMTQDQTRFHAFRRTGAAVVQPAALRKLKMATA
ncbi:phage major capsid protein [Methylobacterium oryzisoli]|uniref:phage major capsid protein n=1 Tax=Methylobacterium oryzisoli TaxID=3385502 RepID=UPI00397E3E8D